MLAGLLRCRGAIAAIVGVLIVLLAMSSGRAQTVDPDKSGPGSQPMSANPPPVEVAPAPNSQRTPDSSANPPNLPDASAAPPVIPGATGNSPPVEAAPPPVGTGASNGSANEPAKSAPSSSQTAPSTSDIAPASPPPTPAPDGGPGAAVGQGAGDNPTTTAPGQTAPDNGNGGAPAPANSPGFGLAQSLAAWDRIVTVLQHPRCMNCHQQDVPLQGDARRVHIPRVVRGADGLGVPVLRCAACHGDTGNNPSSGVPGAPHWHLAPASMVWQGLSSGDICRMLKDPALNGNRTPDGLVEHMDTEPLVQWGWDPGSGRAPVPILHSEFVNVMKVWVAAGAACPD